MRTGSGSPHFREAALGTVCHEDSQMTGQAGRQTECRTEGRTEGRETGTYRMEVSDGLGRLTREK